MFIIPCGHFLKLMFHLDGVQKRIVLQLYLASVELESCCTAAVLHVFPPLINDISTDNADDPDTEVLVVTFD